MDDIVQQYSLTSSFINYNLKIILCSDIILQATLTMNARDNTKKKNVPVAFILQNFLQIIVSIQIRYCKNKSKACGAVIPIYVKTKLYITI